MAMLARRFGRSVVAALLAEPLLGLASAHPMGNFSVNHYSKITLEATESRRYFIDLAEIPTYQELQQANISTTPVEANSKAVITYVAARGAELGHGLILDVDGKPTPLHLISSGVIFLREREVFPR
jgi:nickel/cobalt exporter